MAQLVTKVRGPIYLALRGAWSNIPCAIGAWLNIPRSRGGVLTHVLEMWA